MLKCDDVVEWFGHLEKTNKWEWGIAVVIRPRIGHRNPCFEYREGVYADEGYDQITKIGVLD